MLLNGLGTNQLARQYTAYKNNNASASQAAVSVFGKELQSAESVKPDSAAKVSPTEADALYTKQNSLYNTRNIQGEYGVTTIVTEPRPIGWLSIDEIRLLSQKQAADRAAYDATKTSPAPNTSLKWYEGDTLSWSEKMARIDGSVKVTIGKNELPLLMEEIENALANGESYLTAIEKFYDNKNHYAGGGGFDKIFIDPYTGTVKDAEPPSTAYMGAGESKILHNTNDADAVWDLAYDLQQFLKLRVFGETDGLSESEAESAIAEIKERQSNKCTYRFG